MRLMPDVSPIQPLNRNVLSLLIMRVKWLGLPAFSFQKSRNRLARHFFIFSVLARLGFLTTVLAFLTVRFVPVFSAGTLR